MAHIHGVYDTDTHFIVDPVKKELTVAEGYEKVKVIQHDHNSERFTFELPRYIEGHDMSTCNKVEVHYLNICSQTKEESAGLYVRPCSLFDFDRICLCANISFLVYGG